MHPRGNMNKQSMQTTPVLFVIGQISTPIDETSEIQPKAFEQQQQPGRDRRFSDYPTAATASPPIAAKRKHRMNPSAGTVDGEQDKVAQTTNNPPSEAQKSQNDPAPKSWSFSKAKRNWMWPS
ncbi:uncharacterized protein LOC6041389 [Culex quinquefasciatus]|uniref:uncharacterized protein LOC6041389 n=1 Tax=Culex quinquefasciatus TaxID=7176 RepID=UPI0018E3567E|nr:uncharacterized protein LOC6041389 [Culex quinquefasciatus]